MLVWSFNLHQKRNSVTAFYPLSLCPVWFAINFLLCLYLFGVLIYIKNRVTASLLFEALPCLVCNKFPFVVPSETAF
ncbi:MAG: hypothetical protein LBC75_01930 [Fibromonadaceae bacterium]|nr:hypothetical protein [Fibromonadaceae bacterium]